MVSVYHQKIAQFLTMLTVVNQDPFTTHVADPDEPQLADSIKSIKSAKAQTIREQCPSGTPYALTVPLAAQVGNLVFGAPFQSILELQVS